MRRLVTEKTVKKNNSIFRLDCRRETSTGVSIRFTVSGWFCEVGGCGKKGAVRRLFLTGSGEHASPENYENRYNLSKL